MFVLLCKDPIVKSYDLGHVRTTNSGAAPLSIEVIQQLSRVLPNTAIGQGYGRRPPSSRGKIYSDILLCRAD
jgi:4-coumarate--CoA ligase